MAALSTRLGAPRTDAKARRLDVGDSDAGVQRGSGVLGPRLPNHVLRAPPHHLRLLRSRRRPRCRAAGAGRRLTGRRVRGLPRTRDDRLVDRPAARARGPGTVGPTAAGGRGARPAHDPPPPPPPAPPLLRPFPP